MIDCPFTPSVQSYLIKDDGTAKAKWMNGQANQQRTEEPVKKPDLIQIPGRSGKKDSKICPPKAPIKDDCLLTTLGRHNLLRSALAIGVFQNASVLLLTSIILYIPHL